MAINDRDPNAPQFNSQEEFESYLDGQIGEKMQSPQVTPSATGEKLKEDGWFDWLSKDKQATDEVNRVKGIADSEATLKQQEPPTNPFDATLTGLTRGSLQFGQQIDASRAMSLERELRSLDNTERRLAKGEKPKYARPSEGSEDDASFYRYGAMSPEDRGALRSKMDGEFTGYLKAVAERQKTLEYTPPAEVLKAIEKPTWGEVWDEFSKAPATFIAAIGSESLPQMLPSVALALGGGIVGGPVGAAAGGGAGSHYTSNVAYILGAIQEEGVDIRDPESVSRALRDPERMERIKNKAAAYATGVAAFDAASMGIASKMLLPAKMLAARPIAKEVANVGVQVPVQGLLGGAGEAAGSTLAGDEVKPGDVFAEMVGEAFTAPVDIATARSSADARQSAADAVNKEAPTRPKSTAQQIIEARNRATSRPDVEPIPATDEQSETTAPAPVTTKEAERIVDAETDVGLEDSERAVFSEALKGQDPEIVRQIGEKLRNPGPELDALTRATTILDETGDAEQSAMRFREALALPEPAAVPDETPNIEAEVDDVLAQVEEDLPAIAADVEDFLTENNIDLDLSEDNIREVGRLMLEGMDVEQALMEYQAAANRQTEPEAPPPTTDEQAPVLNSAAQDIEPDVKEADDEFDGRDLTSISVEIEYTNSDGKPEKARVAADQAVLMVDKRISGLKALLECLA
jgi:hypothetical protein